MNNNIIYGLFCPITGNLHYVGKSTKGLLRPREHMTNSHSEKINDWVFQLKHLGHAPVIKIIETCDINNIDEREQFWINKSIKEGCFLLNSSHNSSDNLLKSNISKDGLSAIRLGKIIKEIRLSLDISAEELSRSAKISGPTLVSIEKGRGNTKISNIINVLSSLGHELKIDKNNGTIKNITENSTRVRVTRRKS